MAAGSSPAKARACAAAYGFIRSALLLEPLGKFAQPLTARVVVKISAHFGIIHPFVCFVVGARSLQIGPQSAVAPPGQPSPADGN